MDFSSKFTRYFQSLHPDFQLPNGIEALFPYRDKHVQQAVSTFSNRYMAGDQKRTFLLGINPGRFGAGVTGISFTDPVKLEENLRIENNFEKRGELSSQFIYEMIDYMGGPEDFYSRFYIGSVCPIGFVKEGKNLNYYDDPHLQKTLEPWIVQQMNKQVEMGARRDCAFSIGKGKNLKFLKALNQKHRWFDQIESIPHPRWVMQYRRKQKPELLDSIRTRLAHFM